MSLYFKEREGELYQSDIVTFLSSLQKNSVHSCVTDPPYNLGIAYSTTDDERSDYIDWCKKWFELLTSVCIGPIVLTPGIANIGLWYQIRQPDWVLCWWKPAALGYCPIGANNWEPILLYGKLPRGSKSGCDVIRAPITPDVMLEGHPCPKPIKWAMDLISLLSLPNQSVIDPFIGSGTVAVACKRLNRRYIGIDHDEDYLKIAKTRLLDEDGANVISQIRKSVKRSKRV